MSLNLMNIMYCNFIQYFSPFNSSQIKFTDNIFKQNKIVIKPLEMFKLIFLLVLIQFSFHQASCFDINFRKNITIAPDSYYYLNHSYIKDLTQDTIDYIESIQTDYLISLTYPFDNTPFDIYVFTQEEFECYLLIQNQKSEKKDSSCLDEFFQNSNKFYLKRTQAIGSLYKKNIELYKDYIDRHIIVIDNTQFPKLKLNTEPFFWGSYQTTPINIDITLTSTLTFQTNYFIFYLILLGAVGFLGGLLTIFMAIYYYKYKLVSRKKYKLKKMIEAESY